MNPIKIVSRREVSKMSEQDSKQMQIYDEFVERMLEVLFELGLMPMSLSDAPAKFEKYPQRLLVLLRTSGDVEKAFAVWRSEVLRKQKYGAVKEAAFPKLEELGAWMCDESNRQLLQFPSTIRHLRQSMYGRSYAYLYPRLALTYEYRDHCWQHTEAMAVIQVQSVSEQPKAFFRAVADEGFVNQYFNDWTPLTQKLIREAYGEKSVRPLLEAAKTFLLQNPHWFNKTFNPKKEA
jgi:hypothetical protein